MRVRVPSGKITTFLPPRISRAARCRLSMARSRLLRSTKMVPAIMAAQPTGTIHFTSFLARNTAGMGMPLIRTGGSRLLSWLDMKITGSCSARMGAGRSSQPSRRVRNPHNRNTDRAHRGPTVQKARRPPRNGAAARITTAVTGIMARPHRDTGRVQNHRLCQPVRAQPSPCSGVPALTSFPRAGPWGTADGSPGTGARAGRPPDPAGPGTGRAGPGWRPWARRSRR